MSQPPTVGTFVTLLLLQMMTVALVAQRCGTNIVLPFTRLCWLVWCNLLLLSSDGTVLRSLTLLLFGSFNLLFLWLSWSSLVRWSWVAFSKKIFLPDVGFS
ncbi:hypothetical protein HanIR_Chr11g0527631 [Helianthus annuus]|nr:hypothetical protein HanIR_Chr11g0527631 [Helianthus annuus]